MSTFYVVDMHDFSKYKDPEGRAAKYLRDTTRQSNRLWYKNGYVDIEYHFLFLEKDSCYKHICRASAESLDNKRRYGHELIFLSPIKRWRLI